MKTYTYQIGQGSGDGIAKVAYSEQVFADSLGEAVDKAKAITRLRPEHEEETIVCLLLGDGAAPLWTHTAEEIRAGEERLAVEGRDGAT